MGAGREVRASGLVPGDRWPLSSSLALLCLSMQWVTRIISHVLLALTCWEPVDLGLP